MLSYARFEMTRVIRNPRFMLLVALVPVLLYLVGLRQGAGAAIGAARPGSGSCRPPWRSGPWPRR